MKGENMEYKNYKLKKKINPILSFSVVIIAIFYIVAISSGMWFPRESGEYEIAKYNMKYEVSDLKRSFSLIDWEYSREQKMMEIQFKVTNKNFDGVENYSWSAAERFKGKLDIKPVYEDTNILVVHIKDIPKRWNTISVRIALNRKNPETEFFLKFYGDGTNIKTVEHIPKRNQNDYYIKDTQNDIKLYEASISENNKNIKMLEKEIKEINKSSSEMVANMEFLTEKEVEEVQTEVERYNSLIQSDLQKIEEYEKENEEYRQRIEKLNEKLKTYK